MQPKRKIYEDFWSEFEDTIANTGLISTIPSCVKELLTAVGYNSAFSLLTIDESKLSNVEEYIETNCRQLVETFEIYQSRKPFSFLPGHRDLIFGISSELARLQDSGQSKRAKKSTQCNLNERDLRASLVNQLSTFATGLGLDHNWSNSIDDFEMDSTGNAIYAKCAISCKICSSVISTRYDKHWKISNIFKHIRTHVEGNKKTVTTQKTTQVNVQNDKKSADEGNCDEFEEIYVDVQSMENLNEDDIIAFDPEK